MTYRRDKYEKFMDLFWLLLMSIVGMIVLAVLINWGRDSFLGQQNTFLFLEAIIVGMFVFLTLALFIILGYLSNNKKPDISIIEVRDYSQLNIHSNVLQEDSLIKSKDL